MMNSTSMHANGTAYSNINIANIAVISDERAVEGRNVREKCIVILDHRALDGHCLARCFAAKKADMDFVAVTTIAEWKSVENDMPPLAAILFTIGARCADDPYVMEQVRMLSAEFEVPVVLLADSVDLLQIMKALEYGAKGYIPSSVSIDVCIEAIALSLAGGIFLPASSVLSMRPALEVEAAQTRPLESMFTARQAEVATALRRGKANKIIAYELNLRESTVKVHIRNIMKKMKASNRTEVAYKLNDLFPLEPAV